MRTLEDGSATLTIGSGLVRVLRERAERAGIDADDLVEMAIRHCLAEMEVGMVAVTTLERINRRRTEATFFDWSR